MYLVKINNMWGSELVFKTLKDATEFCSVLEKAIRVKQEHLSSCGYVCVEKNEMTKFEIENTYLYSQAEFDKLKQQEEEEKKKAEELEAEQNELTA